MSDADFSNALTQAPTSGPVGLSPTFQGEIAGWKAASAQPISLEWPQVNLVGEIQTTGLYRAMLPAQPPATSLKSMDSYIRSIAIYSDCSVDTLVVSPATSQAGEVNLFTARPSAVSSAAIKPQTSPLPNFTFLNPFQRYENAHEQAIYVSEDTTVKGELLCLNRYSDGGGSHLFVNMTFARGWNLATTVIEPGRDIRIPKMLLRGGVAVSPVAP